MDEVKLTFGEWLKDRLVSSNWRQWQFAEVLEVSESAVSSWVNDIQLPSRQNLIAIARAFDESLATVFERAGYDPKELPPEVRRRQPMPGRPRPIERAVQITFVPVIGLAPADTSRSTSEAPTVMPMYADDLGAVRDPAIVVVSGSCMAGRYILDGDRVLIDRDAEPTAGDVVFIRLGDECSLKEWWPEDESVVLRAASPGYPPIRVRFDQDDAELIGVARKVIRVEEIGGPTRR